jgi:hypothetical protein
MTRAVPPAGVWEAAEACRWWFRTARRVRDGGSGGGPVHDERALDAVRDAATRGAARVRRRRGRCDAHGRTGAIADADPMSRSGHRRGRSPRQSHAAVRVRGWPRRSDGREVTAPGSVFSASPIARSTALDGDKLNSWSPLRIVESRVGRHPPPEWTFHVKHSQPRVLSLGPGSPVWPRDAHDCRRIPRDACQASARCVVWSVDHPHVVGLSARYPTGFHVKHRRCSTSLALVVVCTEKHPPCLQASGTRAQSPPTGG